MADLPEEIRSQIEAINYSLTNVKIAKMQLDLE